MDSMDIETLAANLLFKEINETLPTVHDKSEIMQICLDGIIASLKANRGFILLYDPESKKLEVHAYHNVDPEYLFYGETISLTVINIAFQEEKPVLISDALADPVFAKKTSIVLSELRSVICVPIANDAGVYGIVYVDNRMKIGLYKEEHLQYLKDCAEILVDIVIKYLPQIKPRPRDQQGQPPQ